MSQLYDLTADPQQGNNLIGKNPEAARELHRMLVGFHAGDRRPRPPAASAVGTANLASWRGGHRTWAAQVPLERHYEVAGLSRSPEPARGGSSIP